MPGFVVPGFVVPGLVVPGFVVPQLVVPGFVVPQLVVPGLVMPLFSSAGKVSKRPIARALSRPDIPKSTSELAQPLMRLRHVIVAALLLCAACDVTTPARVQAPADSAAGEVAFELAGPNEAALIVPVEINGRAPVNFVLDTGATMTCIDVSLARELQLPDQKTIGGVAIGALAAGRIETVQMDTLRLGNAVAYDILACKLDLAALRTGFGAQGLLGLNFLKSFDVALDFERRVLTLTAPD